MVMQNRWPWITLVATLAARAYARPLVVASIDEHPPIAAEPLAPEHGTELPPPPVDRAFAAIHLSPPEDPRVRIDRSASTVREVGDVELVTMTVTASSTALLWHDTEMTVSVPRAAKVVGLALEQGGHAKGAEMVLASTARERYDESIRFTVDPALVELEAHGRDYDRYRLSMYPVSSEQQVTAKLTIVLPRTDRLVIDLAGQREEHRAGTAAVLTSADRALLASAPVTGGRSLYVMADDAVPSEPEIVNVMRASRQALALCTSDDVTLDMKFTIGVDGHVTVNSVGNAPPDVADCVSHTIESLHVHPSPRPLVVTYPVHLHAR
jgi:hypothetical protein